MIKFRYKRKESLDNSKINIDKKDGNKQQREYKPSKGVKKDYLDCIRAVIVSQLLFMTVYDIYIIVSENKY